MGFTIAIIGAGVAGLSSALTLKRDGHDVTVYDKDSRNTGPTPDERRSGKVYHARASLAAAGFWYPFHVNARDSTRTRDWAYGTFDRFEALSSVVGSGIIPVVLDEWFETESDYSNWKNESSETYWRNDTVKFGIQRLEKGEVHKNFACGVRMNTYVARMPDYLQYLRKELNKDSQKSRIVTRNISNINDPVLKPFDFVVNCTGSDAGSFVADDDVKPKVGHVIVANWIEHESLYPQGATENSCPRIVFLTTGDYANTFPFYLVPRGSKGDGNPDIVVGGTYYMEIPEKQDDNWDRQQFERIETTLCDLFPELSRKMGISGDGDRSLIMKIRGRRPFRITGPRVGWGTVDGHPVIHNYGHGGGGITLSWGCALDVARIASRFDGEDYFNVD